MPHSHAVCPTPALQGGRTLQITAGRDPREMLEYLAAAADCPSFHCLRVDCSKVPEEDVLLCPAATPAGPLARLPHVRRLELHCCHSSVWLQLPMPRLESLLLEGLDTELGTVPARLLSIGSAVTDKQAVWPLLPALRRIQMDTHTPPTGRSFLATATGSFELVVADAPALEQLDLKIMFPESHVTVIGGPLAAVTSMVGRAAVGGEGAAAAWNTAATALHRLLADNCMPVSKHACGQ